jgi:hypothetical protein
MLLTTVTLKQTFCGFVNAVSASWRENAPLVTCAETGLSMT